jgi:hypothetical protein
METSKTSTGEQLNDLTLFAVATPANPLAPQANDEEPTTHDTYGHGLEQPLANYNPTTQFWRTSEDISLWGDYKSLEKLPKSGMTRNGVLYLQPEWVRPTDETELSLWPTPTAHPDNSNLKGKFKNPTLGDAVRMWPTPTTQETEHPKAEITQTGRRKAKNGKTSHSLGLADAVQKWPTPQANDAKNPYARIREFSQATMLGEAVLNADPTAIGGKLNPTWVEWLMGFPTGWTDLED